MDKKDPGLLHDDEGNTDDRRVAGWVVIVGSMVLAAFGIWRDSTITTQIFTPGIWAGVALLGATVAEKFTHRG